MLRTSHKYVGGGFLSGALLVAIIGIGCGGGGGMQSSNNNGNNTTSASGGGSSGGSGSGSGGSGSGGSTPYFFAALLSNADSSNHGQISLNASGGGSVQLQSVAATTNYSVEFCQFPNGTSNCFSVASATSDASGNTQSAFTFSRSGTWSGIFLLQPSNGGTAYDSNFPEPSSGTQYQNPLQRAGTVTGGTPSFWACRV